MAAQLLGVVAQHAALPSQSLTPVDTLGLATSRVLVATPSWHSELEESARRYDPWSVPFWLHSYMRKTHGDYSAPARDSVPLDRPIYLGVYVHTGVLTAHTNERNRQWLDGSTELELLDGSKLDLTDALEAGQVYMTAYGPDQCSYVRGALRAVRLIYFDRHFGTCDETWGIMAPTYADAALARSTLRASTMRPRRLFFYGHLPKPYIEWPASSVRFRIWRALKDMPNSTVQASCVNGGVVTTCV